MPKAKFDIVRKCNICGQPVTSRQVYTVVCRHPQTFVREAGRILLSM